MVTSIGIGKAHSPGGGIIAHFEGIAPHLAAMQEAEQRVETGFVDDAEHIVVAFGTAAKFVRYVVRRMRADGMRVGYVRPISLWPFPTDALAEASEGKRTVMVFENSAGQLVDDVKIAVLGRSPIVPIGGISTDASGFGVGDMYDAEVIRGRIEAVVAGQEVAS